MKIKKISRKKIYITLSAVVFCSVANAYIYYLVVGEPANPNVVVLGTFIGSLITCATYVLYKRWGKNK